MLVASAKARIRRLIKDPPITHARTRAVIRASAAQLSRKEAVLLAQLRSEHCRRLAAYHKVVDDTADATCTQCGREPETLEHWLQKCSASAARRIAEFGVATPPLSVLVENPVAVLAYARRSWPV